MRVSVSGASTPEQARGIGKSVVNSPLFGCAIAGNDPNVGRLVAAVGKYLGANPHTAGGQAQAFDPNRCSAAIGGHTIFEGGNFVLDADMEEKLFEYIEGAQLYKSSPTVDSEKDSVPLFHPPVTYPPHERLVEIDIDIGLGNENAVVYGADLTHEYVTENADYRS